VLKAKKSPITIETISKARDATISEPLISKLSCFVVISKELIPFRPQFLTHAGRVAKMLLQLPVQCPCLQIQTVISIIKIFHREGGREGGRERERETESIMAV